MDRFALVVMDLQAGVCARTDEPNRRGIFPKVRAALAAARDAGVPVIHVRVAFDEHYTLRTSRSPRFDQTEKVRRMQLGTPDVEFVPDAQPLPGEPVVTKGCQREHDDGKQRDPEEIVRPDAVRALDAERHKPKEARASPVPAPYRDPGSSQYVDGKTRRVIRQVGDDYRQGVIRPVDISPTIRVAVGVEVARPGPSVTHTETSVKRVQAKASSQMHDDGNDHFQHRARRRSGDTGQKVLPEEFTAAREILEVHAGIPQNWPQQTVIMTPRTKPVGRRSRKCMGC